MKDEKHEDRCPLCGADLDGGPIPERDRENYAPPYRWSRRIGIYSIETDRTVAWMCPDCKGQWERTSHEG